MLDVTNLTIQQDARAIVSSLDMLAITETWGRVIDTELAGEGYRLVSKDRADGKKGSYIAIMLLSLLLPLTLL